MTLAPDRLRLLIRHLLDARIPEPELTALVHYSRAVVESHLRHFRSSARSLCEAQGITLTDLAYDCVADAYARDEERSFHHVRGMVGSLNRSLEAIPGHELLLAFRGFLTSFADAHVARLFAQVDPAGAKIHRNIRLGVKSGKLFSLERDFRGYVIKPVCRNLFEEREPFPEPELELAFRDSVRGDRSIPALLKALYGALTGQTRYRRSVTLAHAVQLFRNVYREEDSVAKELMQRPGQDGLPEFELKDIREKVESALKEKILLTYLVHGKLNRREAEGAFAAMRDILEDWCSSDGLTTSLFEYLKRHLPVTEVTYESLYRVKMEYLLKIARDEFSALLTRDI